MTVKELREAIANLPDDMRVMSYSHEYDTYSDIETRTVQVFGQGRGEYTDTRNSYEQPRENDEIITILGIREEDLS